jgi:hypothetical protein
VKQLELLPPPPEPQYDLFDADLNAVVARLPIR